jgi:hypothetical protein
LVEPILYHEFVPGGSTPPREDLYDWDRRLIPFLRTVLLRPDLAALVRTCFIHDFLLLERWRRRDEVWGPEDLDKDEVEVDPTVIAALKEAAEIRGVDLSEFLQCCVGHVDDRFYYGPLLVMLLACLPNISCFYLDSQVMGIPLAALNSAGVTTLPLRTINVYRPRPSDRDCDQYVSGLLEVASSTLRNLNIIGAHGDGLLKRLDRPLTNLQNLSHTGGSHSWHDIDSFLSCCTGLTSLNFASSKSTQ